MRHSSPDDSPVDMRLRESNMWQKAELISLGVIDIKIAFAKKKQAIVDQALLVGLLITVAEAAIVATIFSYINWPTWLIILSASAPAFGSLVVTPLRLGVASALESKSIAKYKKENGCE